MTDYSELVKALRETAKHLDGISRFPYDDDPAKRIYSKNMADAAAAIEELDAEETRLLMITSELQDKVVELEEELNDADIAADDNAWQIEELQKDLIALQKCYEIADTTVDKVAKQLPKRGEWIDDEFGAKCSYCGKYAYWSKYEIPWKSPYCPLCGAKMEAQDG